MSDLSADEQMLVQRMMEFMGNDNEQDVKRVTDKLSAGSWEFRDAPQPVMLVDVATEDEMRELYWPCVVEECVHGRADRLRDLIQSLHKAGMLDTATLRRIGPLLRPSPLRSGSRSPARSSSPVRASPRASSPVRTLSGASAAATDPRTKDNVPAGK